MLNEYNIPMPAPGETAAIPNSTLYEMNCADDTFEQMEEMMEQAPAEPEEMNGQEDFLSDD